MYCHIENGSIDEGPIPLPTAWRNISGLHLLPKAKLKKLGWLPVRKVGFEPFDPATQVRTDPDYAVGAGEVVAAYTVRAKTAQELDAEKTVAVAGLFNNRALKAYILAVNGGSIMPGSNMTPAQLEAAIKAHL